MDMGVSEEGQAENLKASQGDFIEQVCVPVADAG